MFTYDTTGAGVLPREVALPDELSGVEGNPLPVIKR